MSDLHSPPYSANFLHRWRWQFMISIPTWSVWNCHCSTVKKHHKRGENGNDNYPHLGSWFKSKRPILQSLENERCIMLTSCSCLNLVKFVEYRGRIYYSNYSLIPAVWGIRLAFTNFSQFSLFSSINYLSFIWTFNIQHMSLNCFPLRPWTIGPWTKIQIRMAGSKIIQKCQVIFPTLSSKEPELHNMTQLSLIP